MEGASMERLTRVARRVMATTVMVGLLTLTPTPASAAPGDYRLGFGDTLSVSVVGQPNVAVAAQPVRPDGRITLPLVQDILVQGKSVQEITAILARAYRPYFADAQIVVQVAKFRELRVTLIGQVQKPGTVSFASVPTLVEALAGAGGLSDRAERSAVKVLLPAGGGQKVYDLEGILTGRQPMPTVPEGAVVEVSEVWGPDFYRVLPVAASLITAGVTASVLLLR